MIVTERFQLSPLVKRSLRQRKEKFGFGLLGMATYYRTYSRQMEGDRQERWADTVIRVVEGVMSVRKDWMVKHRLRWSEQEMQALAGEMAVSMFTMKFLPSGRNLWVTGSEYMYKRGGMAANNPLTGDTLVPTSRGVYPIESLVGREVDLLTSGGWKPATISYMGTQPIQEINLVSVYRTATHWKRGTKAMQYRVTATPDHGWSVYDRDEKVHDLSVGDIVRSVTNQDNDQSILFQEGFRHGLWFADGTIVTEQTDTNTSHYALRLCGKKSKYLSYFEEDPRFEVSYPESYDGDSYIRIRSAHLWKELPLQNEDADYVRGFIEGWTAVDGYQQKEKMILSSQDHDALEWLENHAIYAGYLVIGRSEQSSLKTNYGRRKAALRSITLIRSERGFKVESILAVQQPAPVFCATVPDSGYFALANGMYSGNCAYVHVRDIAKDPAIIMNMLLKGVGVGFGADEDFNPNLDIPDGENARTVVIEDTGEAWALSVDQLIRSYMGGQYVNFDYSKIRGKGAPIKGFGGVASGPAPLKELHERLYLYLDMYCSDRNYDATRLLGDIINAIGAAVVAGNVRRSAELYLGHAGDSTFLDLKNYTKNPDRAEIGWMSNNSIRITDHDDFLSVPYLAGRIRDNGEPGFVNMINIKKYGRYGELMPDTAEGTNPCAEATLESYELCCLVEIFPSLCKDEEEFYRTTKMATFFASTISLLLTEVEEVNAVVTRNHRIGVSMSGIADIFDRVPATQVIRMARRGYRIIEEENRRLAREAGVPESIRKTVVKPSGSVSLLAGVSPGMHYPPFTRYIRRIRVGTDSPIIPLLESAGVPQEPDKYSSNTLIFEFPVKSEARRSQRDVTIWQKGQMLTMLQQHWADQMVSNTLTFDPKTEGDQLVDFIAMTLPQVKSMSLLPDHGEDTAYEQMPYEAISEDDYLSRSEAITEVDWSKFEGSDGQDSRYCESDQCDLT